MKQPLATVPEAIVDACHAVRRGELDADEEQLVATFHAADRGVQEHVLATLGHLRRQRGGQ